MILEQEKIVLYIIHNFNTSAVALAKVGDNNDIQNRYVEI